MRRNPLAMMGRVLVCIVLLAVLATEVALLSMQQINGVDYGTGFAYISDVVSYRATQLRDYIPIGKGSSEEQTLSTADESSKTNAVKYKYTVEEPDGGEE